MKSKHHALIRTDGTTKVFTKRPTYAEIHDLHGCSCLTTVTLNRHHDTVMLMYDAGMIDGKPVNAEATRKFHRICVRHATLSTDTARRRRYAHQAIVTLASQYGRYGHCRVTARAGWKVGKDRVERIWVARG